MGRWLKAARAIGGLLSIVTLLGLVAADTVYAAVTLDATTITLLLGVISVLLGADMLGERIPVELTIGQYDEDGNGGD